MIILLSNINNLSFAQNTKGKERNYLGVLENAFHQDTHKHNWKSYLQNARNEGEFTFSLIFLFYKTVFSSQDIDACVFTPSCSVYMMEAIKEHGVIRGFVEGQDRLTRCHPFANGKYPVNTETHKLHDPID